MESQLIARVNLGAVLVPMTVLWLLLLMLLSSAYPCLGSDLILLEPRLYQSDTVRCHCLRTEIFRLGAE